MKAENARVLDALFAIASRGCSVFIFSVTDAGEWLLHLNINGEIVNSPTFDGFELEDAWSELIQSKCLKMLEGGMVSGSIRVGDGSRYFRVSLFGTGSKEPNTLLLRGAVYDDPSVERGNSE